MSDKEKREISYLDAIREAMIQLMEQDEDVYLIGEDVAEYGGAFGVSVGMLEKFGKKRIINSPISEDALVGVAAGSALTGMRPIVEIMFSDFITIAMDEITNQAAKIRYMFGGKATVPFVLRTAGGGGTGAAGQHSQSLESLVAHIPGLKVVMPSSPYDAKGLLISSVKDNNPVIFIEHKLLYKNKKYIEHVPEDMYDIPIGVGKINRKGSDITIATYSYMVKKSLEVAEKLYSKEKIDCEVIDLRTLRPLDIDIILNSLDKTGKLLCVEEDCGFGGFMGEVVSQVVEKGFDLLDAPILRVSGKNSPVPYSLVLEDEMIPNHERIEAGVYSVLKSL